MAAQELLISKGEQRYFEINWTKKGTGEVESLSNYKGIVVTLENQRDKSLKVFSWNFETSQPYGSDSTLEIINRSLGYTRILLTTEYISSLTTMNYLNIYFKYKLNDGQIIQSNDIHTVIFKVLNNPLKDKEL